MSKNLKVSEHLQQVHNESEKIISSPIQRLDRISNHIKAFEITCQHIFTKLQRRSYRTFFLTSLISNLNKFTASK